MNSGHAKHIVRSYKLLVLHSYTVAFNNSSLNIDQLLFSIYNVYLFLMVACLGHRIVVLSYCHTIVLSYYRTIILSYCRYRTVVLSYWRTGVLSRCRTIVLWYCRAVILSHCHTVTLSYNYTIVYIYINYSTKETHI